MTTTQTPASARLREIKMDVSAIRLRRPAWDAVENAARNGGEVGVGVAKTFTTECANRGVMILVDGQRPRLTDLGWAAARYMGWAN